MTKAVLGVIGGSGVYDLPGLENVREERIASPWGEPSAPLTRGVIAGLPIVFLPRHGKGHVLSPSDINYRANIDVLKRAGVTDLVSLSACGSFKEELPPGTFVLVGVTSIPSPWRRLILPDVPWLIPSVFTRRQASMMDWRFSLSSLAGISTPSFNLWTMLDYCAAV